MGNDSDWNDISHDAKDLICHLMKMNPRERYTAQQMLNHGWIKDYHSHNCTCPAGQEGLQRQDVVGEVARVPLAAAMAKSQRKLVIFKASALAIVAINSMRKRSSSCPTHDPGPQIHAMLLGMH